jgi:hypothetical protein
VQNACEPTSEGSKWSEMAYRPVMGFLAHSLIHSFFSLSCICQCSFAIVVISVIGSSSVASFASLSALSFPSIPMCPGTHVISIFAPLLSSRNVVAISTNFCDSSWLGPGFSLVIALTADVLSANSMIVGCLLLVSGVFCWKAIAASSPLSNASISASYTSANLPIPSFPLVSESDVLGICGAGVVSVHSLVEEGPVPNKRDRKRMG